MVDVYKTRQYRKLYMLAYDVAYLHSYSNDSYASDFAAFVADAYVTRKFIVNNN